MIITLYKKNNNNSYLCYTINYNSEVLSIFSREVLRLIKDNKQGEWEHMVPEGVDEIIKAKCLFGYNCDIN